MREVCLPQKAEATLRRWDLLQKEERDRRFSVLKQRVLMQRELIAKASKLSEELREIEDEKKLEVCIVKKRYMHTATNAKVFTPAGD